MDAPRAGGERWVRRDFSGGLVLPALKPPPRPVERLPLPPRLAVPLLQHAGVECDCEVSVGQHVGRFQRLGDVPEGALGAPVHAPAAGTVVALERRPVALPGRPEALHVLIDVDAREIAAWQAGAAWAIDAPHRMAPLDPATSTDEALRARIADAGIVGLGGAGFPSADKLAVARRLLILNGAECEPVVASDEALLRERAAEVLAGGRLLARISGAARLVLAMEQRMASALASVRSALDAGHGKEEATIELVLLPDRYPAGGERQLIQGITGEEVPDGGLPRDLGVVVHNVGTAHAAWRAIVHGEPLVSRFVTVGGDGVDSAGTYETALGTPVGHLADAAGGWRADARHLRAGGPMMGIPLESDAVAVGKTVFAVTAWRAPREADDALLHGRAPPILPCIRCGDCASVCPARLQPQLLEARIATGDAAGAATLGLGACIECGACDAVCPSAIPLTAHFAQAREQQRRAAHERRAAEAARLRFEQRIERLRRDADEAAEAQARRVKRLSGAAAAALAKARAKRAAAEEDPQ